MALKPSAPNAYPRPDLGVVFNELDLVANQAGLVGLKIAPLYDSQVAQGFFNRITLKSMLKKQNTDRQPGGSYNSRTPEFEEDPGFFTRRRGFKEGVDDEERTRLGSQFDAEMLAAERSRDTVLRGHENRVVKLVNTLPGGQQADVGIKWTLSDTATPIADIRDGVQTVRLRSGVKPNALVIEDSVFAALQDNQEIIERIKYSGVDDPKKSGINEAALAKVFGLREVIVASSLEDTTAEGKAPVLASIWNKTKAFLFYKYDGMDLERVQFARTFRYAKLGGPGNPIVVESYRVEDQETDYVRAKMQTHERTIYQECGQVFGNVA